MEFVPIALACGHVTSGFVSFRRMVGPGEDGLSRIECPDGCGWQTWIADPISDELVRLAEEDPECR